MGFLFAWIWSNSNITMVFLNFVPMTAKNKGRYIAVGVVAGWEDM